MAGNRRLRKRLTPAQKQERIEQAHKDARTREWLSDLASRANKLRSQDKEFHGLEREFINLQKKMISDYEISKDIKHPRDVGTVREVLLRSFFIENKLLPQKYGISSTSIRVASTSGHLSNEIDILFYNAFESFTLMHRQDVFEVLPVEHCFGAIQVKSRLSKKELESALHNIASFKKLKRTSEDSAIHQNPQHRQDSGFGIIFSYDTEMDWTDIVAELNYHAENSDRNLLPNAVFILNKGFFMFGSDAYASIYNSDIVGFDKIRIYGNPDHQGHCLYQLYNIISSLLKATTTRDASPFQYFRLPLTAGDYSYEYTFGSFAEFGHCEHHGDFSKTYTPEKLEKVITWCRTAEPINWIKATELAYGQPGDNIDAYKKQPGDVRIYNPEGLALSEILVMEQETTMDGVKSIYKSLAFDLIKSCGLNIYIPYYYQHTESLVQGCKKCKKAETPS